MERRPQSQAPAPNGNGWRERAATLHNAIVAFDRGAVQIIGREPLALHDSVITIPFHQLMEIATQVTGIFHPAHPAHGMLNGHHRGPKV